MAEYTYFANRATLTVGGETVAVLKGIEITANWETETLYGMDSIFRVDEAKHTVDVEVKITSAQFDPNMAAGFSTIYGESFNGTEGTTALTIADTNSVAVFDVVATIRGTGQTTSTTITVSDVYFEAFPFPMSENDFITFELTGHGKTLTFATS